MNASVRCPSLAIDVSSFDADPTAAIEVTAGPVDLAPGVPVTYAWSAPAGDFADPHARVTTYLCPSSSGPGPQTILVSATRSSCTVSQQIVIVCSEAPIDAAADDVPADDGSVGGASGAADAGADSADASDDAASSEVRCGSDPTIDSTVDEGTTCNQCTLDNCTTLENAKAGVEPTAGCHHLASDRDRQSCEALYCCLRANRCVIDGDPTTCWCGSADPSQCALGTAIANGPCLTETEEAAGTTQQSEIALRLVDPTFAVGGAMNLAICRASFCATPPAPACQGY